MNRSASDCARASAYRRRLRATVSTSSDRTETAEFTLDGVERTIVNEVGQTLNQIELAIRIWASVALPDFVVPGSSRSIGGVPLAIKITPRLNQQASEPFFASEFVDVAPVGVTVDPPARLVVSYLASLDDPQALRLYRYGEDGAWHPMPTTIASLIQ